MLPVLLLLCSLGSCKKFLDEPQRSSMALINTTKACMMVLDFSTTYIAFPADAVAGTDDYYLIDGDFNNLTDEARGIYTWDSATIHLAGAEWLSAYKRIYSVNVVLESLKDIADKDPSQEGTEEFNLAKGMSLFMRAYNFYNIAQLYAPTFNEATADKDLSIPLRLSSDINGNSVRSTVRETYNRILQDLEEAGRLLPPTTLIATRPDQSTVFGFMARVYLTMRNYEKAGAAADSCLKRNNNASHLIDYNSISQTSTTPFVRFSSEVLLHTTSNARVNTWKIVPELYNSFDAHDLRKKIFFKENGGTNAGTYLFTGNYEPSTTALFNGICIDEIFLIRAECAARVGHAGDAMNDLNTLLRTRWETGTYTDKTAADASDALNQVLTERRKELVLRDLRWSDLRRLNLEPEHTVTLQRTVAGKTYTLPPNSLRYTLLLPADVILNSSMEQNPR